MSLTKPPSPIVVGGVEFPHWRQFSDASILIHVGAPEVHQFNENLGKHIVGQAEDGSNVLWLISTINVVPEGAEVIVYPEAPLPERNTRLMMALPIAGGAIITEAAAKALEGQWLTLTLGGQHALGQIVEAAPTPDGTRVDLLVDTDWAGLVIRLPEGE